DRVRAIPDRRVGNQFDLGATGSGAGVSLVPSIPAVDEFPMAVWERLRAQVLAKKGVNLLRYSSNRGDADLRKALAAYLCDFRAARCHPDQIVIVAGMQQAMLIGAMAVLNPGDVAWIEDPCYQQTRRVLTLAGVKIVPKPVDNQGIMIARSPKGTVAEDDLRNALPSISSWRHDEFPASDRLTRFCACSRRFYFRRRL
ncbi:MAG TPA: aminotransferase class I/II-fold pyridoxal phosphate-dependent enzyme, partial [Verrucomicrobiae bacterium]|nr:aminotransferase class I/II-fold pyridoxal phosphate-dependent enzyme [Verrucomicrobiae bacterium]